MGDLINIFTGRKIPWPSSNMRDFHDMREEFHEKRLNPETKDKDLLIAACDMLTILMVILEEGLEGDK